MDKDGLLKDFEWISKYAHCYPVNGNDVVVLESPQCFYQALSDGILTAKKRVVMTALYWGTGQLEKSLVDKLMQTLKKKEEKDDKMEVEILIDYTRGSRKNLGSSTQMLLPLVKEYKNPAMVKGCSLQVSLYHSPQLRGTLKSFLPDKWNEIIGLAHMKVFVFDDTVIISGANLSNDYFTNRQDRYIKFENSKPLADYFHALVKAVSSFSFHLQHDGSVKFSADCPHHPFEGSYDLFISYIRSCLQPLIYPEFVSTQMQPNCTTSGLVQKSLRFVSWLWNGNYWPDKKQNIFQDMDGASQLKVLNNKDTFVFPSVQLGFAGIKQDEFITKKILQSAKSSSQVCLTSGYFNLTNDYVDIITKSMAKFDIYVASPEANGFLNAHGLPGYIPSMYVYLTKKFYDRLQNDRRNESVKLWEYIKPGWTYHAKGMWFYDQHKTGPFLTMIGSPNFGSRSVQRDLEAQVTVITSNKNLMKQLHMEKSRIVDFSQPIVKETFVQPRYNVPKWVAMISAIIRHYF
uniref:CDP-diacylglycerol--glycerol-3-phosphate 3-phosphatidyltransferase n=1 Tax=Phallusia mammillata TaxID=59560 RepID=A0A6F9DNQ8_9ASCI|nr:CDP-diacylglycerol--glycerol-3-phosphate 3-phosphatidyltransferase, mitochondrial-like [Phallusia mammillata]